MNPYFTILGHTFPAYGIMALLGAAAVFIYSIFMCRKYKIDFNDQLYFMVFAFIFLFIGAVLLYQIVGIKELIRLIPYLFTDFEYFKNHITSGLVFYGGLIGVIIGGSVYAKVFKQDSRKLLMYSVPAMPLFHIFGRIGCFLGGCCHGIENARYGIAYTHSITGENGIPFIPVQLYEAAGNLLIFIILLINQRKKHKFFQPLGLYFTIYGTMRFMLEFLRGDTIRGGLGFLSTSQWISLVIIPIGIYCLVASEQSNILNKLYTSTKKAKSNKESADI